MIQYITPSFGRNGLCRRVSVDSLTNNRRSLLDLDLFDSGKIIGTFSDNLLRSVLKGESFGCRKFALCQCVY